MYYSPLVLLLLSGLAVAAPTPELTGRGSGGAFRDGADRSPHPAEPSEGTPGGWQNCQYKDESGRWIGCTWDPNASGNEWDSWKAKEKRDNGPFEAQSKRDLAGRGWRNCKYRDNSGRWIGCTWVNGAPDDFSNNGDSGDGGMTDAQMEMSFSTSSGGK